MKALILNSGLGHRMGVITKEHPKCMTEISYKNTILSRQLRMLVSFGIILIIKIINIISGFVVLKKLVTVHSVMNKITGALLFVLPLTVRMINFRFSAAVVCAVAAFAAVQEGHYIRTGMSETNND